MLYTGESIALHLFKQIKGKKVTLCFMKIDFNHFRLISMFLVHMEF